MQQNCQEQDKRKEQKKKKTKFVKLKVELFYFYFYLLCVTAVNHLYPDWDAFILLPCFVFRLRYFHNCVFAAGLQLEHY